MRGSQAGIQINGLATCIDSLFGDFGTLGIAAGQFGPIKAGSTKLPGRLGLTRIIRPPSLGLPISSLRASRRSLRRTMIRLGKRMGHKHPERRQCCDEEAPPGAQRGAGARHESSLRRQTFPRPRPRISCCHHVDLTYSGGVKREWRPLWLAIIPALMLLCSGCSGINASHSISPASFLLPGLGQTQQTPLNLHPNQSNPQSNPTPTSVPIVAQAN